MKEHVDSMSPAQSALLEKYAHLLRHGFRGAYVHGLDAKGRMIVPSAFRPALGDKFYICMTPDLRAIAIYPAQEWYDECECDAQGRVLLPQKLRARFLSDTRDVEVSGAGSHIRVMRADEAEKEYEQVSADIPDVLAFEAEIAAKHGD